MIFRLRCFSALLLLGVIIFSSQSVHAFPKKGEPAPPFSVRATSGKQLSLADYRGSMLLLQFFATWCPHCRNSMPHLSRLHSQFGDRGVRVLGVSMDDDEEDVDDYLAASPVPFPVAMASESIRSDYGVRSVPTLFVVDKDGVIIEKFNGFTGDTVKKIEKLIP